MALADMSAHRRSIALQGLQNRLYGLEDDEFDANRRDLVNMRSPVQRNLPMFGTDLAGERDYFARTNRQGEIGQIRDMLGGGTGRLNVRQGHSVTQGSDWMAEQAERDAEKQAAQRQEAQTSPLDALGRRVFDAPVGGGEGDLNYARYRAAMAEAEARRTAAETDITAAKRAVSPELGYHEQARAGAYEREQGQLDEEQKLRQDRDRFRTETTLGLERKEQEFYHPASEAERKYRERLTVGPAQARAEGTMTAARQKAMGDIQRQIIQSAGRLGEAQMRAISQALPQDIMDTQWEQKMDYVQRALQQATAASGVSDSMGALRERVEGAPVFGEDASGDAPTAGGMPTMDQPLAQTTAEMEDMYRRSGAAEQGWTYEDFVRWVKNSARNLQITPK